MNLYKKICRILPLYALLPLIFTFVYNMSVYVGAKLIVRDWHHYNLETKLDLQIPYVPWTIVIYFGCYLFWIMNYILSVRGEKAKAYRFLCADVMAKTVCFVFYLALPSTNTRPEVAGSTIWDAGMRLLYQVDSPENLFPSIHCLVSWLSYIGIRGEKRIPRIYRSLSCIIALAVFVSTLTTKQHVLYDVIGGWTLAELCWWISGHTRLGTLYERIWDHILTRLGIAGKSYKRERRGTRE